MYINVSQIRKKRIEIEIEIEIETTVVFIHDFVRCSNITKAKMQAISDAIAICSEKALKNSEI